MECRGHVTSHRSISSNGSGYANVTCSCRFKPRHDDCAYLSKRHRIPRSISQDALQHAGSAAATSLPTTVQCKTNSGVARLERSRVQTISKGPFRLPTEGSSWPHSDGPACTARLALSIHAPLNIKNRGTTSLISLYDFVDNFRPVTTSSQRMTHRNVASVAA